MTSAETRFFHAATGSGWTALPDVDNPRKHDDKMESFVLAETVKYFYLLFDPDDKVPLDKYVFNTEAHPLRILGGSGVHISQQLSAG